MKEIQVYSLKKKKKIRFSRNDITAHIYLLLVTTFFFQFSDFVLRASEMSDILKIHLYLYIITVIFLIGFIIGEFS